MKNKLFFLFLFGTACFLQKVNAQADTILVPTKIDGTNFGALNKFIQGDTLANGDRANPLRTYKLERNTTYFLSKPIAANFDLRIFADKPDKKNRPPIIATGIDNSGAAAVPDLFFQCFEDASFKNVIMQCTPPNLSVEIAFSVQLLKEKGKYEFDGVFWQGSRWLSIGSWAINPIVTIKNCYFKNIQSTTDVFNGRGISFQDRPVDTLIMTNNTFFNVNSHVFQGSTTSVNYFHFEHNTIVNSPKWPIQFTWFTHAVIANNIFYNSHAYGENKDDPEHDVDGLPFGIINISNLPDEIKFPEKERQLTLNNNAYFYSPEIISYFNKYALKGGDFMNVRTKNYFLDSEKYPLFTQSKTTNTNPFFINDGNVVDDLVDWMISFRKAQEVMYWGYDPDNDRFGIEWPVKEDLSYSNITMQKSSDKGLPLGDLNWWNKVEEWEEIVTNVQEINQSNHFQLLQNSPNPFQDQTIISFTLNKSVNVNLSIYDINGKKIKELVNKKLNKGTHHIDWNGKNNRNQSIESGIYFYTLKSENVIESGKMIKINK